MVRFLFDLLRGLIAAAMFPIVVALAVGAGLVCGLLFGAAVHSVLLLQGLRILWRFAADRGESR